MSRFLKFIVHLVVFLLIACILALAVPPFMGISTITIDDTDLETNLPLGSVSYGKEISASSVLVGDSIIVQNGNQVRLYGVQEIDLDNSTFTVIDKGASRGEPKAMTLSGDVTRVIFTVWGIGFLLMAIQSTEGLIIIGLGVLFLIILFVLAEIWGRDKELPDEEPEDEEDDDQTEPDAPAAGEGVSAQAADEQALASEPKSKRQLKKEMRARQKAEVARLKEESRERRKEEKRRIKAAKKIARTGGFIEDMEPVEAILGLDGNSPAEQAADQAHEELKKEIGAVAVLPPSGEIEKIPTAEIPDVKKISPEGDKDSADQAKKGQEETTEETKQEKEEPEQTVKVAIPLYTAEELLEKAKSEGEAPKVIEDDDTGVVLLDYSTIIGSGEEE
ncbi:MAG: hypothetical protein HFH58_05175 [Lachnospiraceae bacterium]|jgi:hypothetical protein|nr:hypothetical protein [Lachnospiraceae bacterium]MCI9099245.1 hypothetical protein [Lachnospiraceae bacterium]